MYAELDLKTCSKCIIPKLLSEFSNDKSRKDGKFPQCKECKAKGDDKTYQNNSERVKKNSKVWKKANPEKVKISNAGYKKRNKAKVNRDTQNYKKRRPQIANANNAKRRALLLQRTPPWLTELHYSQIAMFYDAATRLSKEFGIEMHVDHITPLQGENVSGLHVPWNLQVIPGRENESKKNKV